MMAVYKMIVFSNAAPGAEQEFNVWYDGKHLADVVRLDGVVSAQRFVIQGAFGNSEIGAKYKYLAIYDCTHRRLWPRWSRFNTEGVVT